MGSISTEEPKYIIQDNITGTSIVLNGLFVQDTMNKLQASSQNFILMMNDSKRIKFAFLESKL